ncbi:MAG: glycosyltransferase family 2 protein [Phycisphaerae bacterium]|nr:glycosyltransferase family 2 protein [Phycisphaerae bacterium]
MLAAGTLHDVFLVVYLVVLALVCVYALHRYQLVHLYYKHRKNTPKLAACFRDLPRVTVQLPMYNEQYVARRVIETTCEIDYPREKIEIQVLDDSTDDTVTIARETVERMRAAGHDVVYIHRDNREGFKAGALEEGLRIAKGEFVCIFDADFIPPPSILRETIDYFTDPKVGMVQARWDHINREHSLLTKTQAILLDGHFVIEHAARNRSGRFMSFNGTAGLWRKTCIADAGGWEHDTLTEDLDLSYRAQMKGWRFLFLPDLVSPAELPPEMQSFKQQQHRWAKGGAQTCKKLLPKILRSRLPLKIKTEAFFHLTSCTVYLYIVALTMMLYPAMKLRLSLFEEHEVLSNSLFGLSLFIIATCSPSAFYMCSQREIFRTWADKIKYLPFLMSVGIGISLNNARAAIEGFFGKPGEFVRTPKYGVDTAEDGRWRGRAKTFRYRVKLQPYLELAIGVYLVWCVIMALRDPGTICGAPFLVLFASGYLYVSLSTFYGQFVRGHEHVTQQQRQAG